MNCIRCQIEKLRRERGWSQAETAAVVGLSASMLSRVERGERRLSPAQMIEVARRLGVRPDEAFDIPKLGES